MQYLYSKVNFEVDVIVRQHRTCLMAPYKHIVLILPLQYLVILYCVDI